MRKPFTPLFTLTFDREENMKTPASIVRRVLFTLAVAGSLAFGTAQALPTARQEPGMRACTECTSYQCGSLGGKRDPRNGHCLCCGE